MHNGPPLVKLIIMKKSAKDHFTLGGLNLFGSVQIKELPEDLRSHLDSFLETFDEEDHLCLLGNGGRALWEKISNNEKGFPDFIDNHSVNLVRELDPDAFVLYPHKSKHFPLQQLGRFLNLSRPSSVGLDINSEYGLWFSFRVAFITKKAIEALRPLPFESTCLTCHDRTCITHCPGGAVLHMKFDSKKCVDQRLSTSTCIDTCGARTHCSYRPEMAYTEEQLKYHMLQSHRWLKEFIEINAKDSKDL